MEKEPNEIIQTIFKQMGGRTRIEIMTGAIIYFNNKENIVQFRLDDGAAVGCFEVGYDVCWDLYNCKTYDHKLKVLEELPNIYFDELIPLFEKKTGYYLSF